MKIVAVEAHLFEVPATTPPFAWRHGLPGSEPAYTAGVLRLRTDEGVEGLAPCSRGVILADLVERRLRDELIGADPLAREYLYHRVWELDRVEEFPLYALGLVDQALWDIAGKLVGMPVHRLLGTFRESIPAYASTTTFATTEEFLDVADQCLSLGYKAIKLHAWGDARRDARLCEALRGHVGDDIDLMYDGSAAFDLPDAIYLGHALAHAGYRWYEEPMREFSITAYRRLAERVAVPLLVAETSDGAHYNTADFIASGAATYVRAGAMLRGGISGAMRTAHLAESYGLRAEVHGSPSIVSRHLCMAIPNTTYYESLVSSNPVVRESCVDSDGLVHAPTEPGIGTLPHLPESLGR